jgi:hypothetical protein
MKRFIYKVETTGRNKYGGKYQMATIYKLGKNGVEYVGQTREWNTASYRGSDGEVNEWLLENKVIPKTWSKATGIYCERYKYRGIYWTPYYYVNDKYEIKEI